MSVPILIPMNNIYYLNFTRRVRIITSLRKQVIISLSAEEVGKHYKLIRFLMKIGTI